VIELADGRRLAVSEWGDPTGHPLLMLHGAPGSRLFCPDPDVTASAGVRLITYDRPGYGGSDPRDGRELCDTPADVAALADGLRIERFGLLGVSGGGPHALGCAIALGERLTTVGIAHTPGPLDEVPGAWDALPDHMRPTAEMARQEPFRSRRAVERYMRAWVDDPASYVGVGGPAGDRRVKSDARYRPMLLADAAEAFRQGAGGLADDLVGLWRPWGFRIADVPRGVHLFHGAEDRRGEPDFAYLASALPAAQPVVWPTEGHCGVVPQWGSVLELLLTDKLC
jgi:pimeloyl-ACP methyl ester carboxylesterase